MGTITRSRGAYRAFWSDQGLVNTRVSKTVFYAMSWVKAHIIDLMGLMRRINRQNRPNRRYLLPKCYQFFNQWGAGQPVGN